MNALRHHSLAAHLRRRFGGRVQKIPLDAGFTCPNRDGVLSRAGCLFCNPRGSGSGLGEQGMTLAQQWEHWQARLSRRYKAKGFLAYLQSFSNTYGPLEKLARTLEELRPLPGLMGLCLGTRPDCLDREKLQLLADQDLPELWLELGLQSARDETLARINRGHDFACLARAVGLAHRVSRETGRDGPRICVHVIAGLPGEHVEDFLYTVSELNALPIHGVKFHTLYVCKGSGLAAQWQRGEFTPLSLEDSVDWLARGLAALRPDLVMHRLTGDPAPGELLAPDWAGRKGATLEALNRVLVGRDLWQGRHWDNPRGESPWQASIPKWFSTEGEGPPDLWPGNG